MDRPRRRDMDASLCVADIDNADFAALTFGSTLSINSSMASTRAKSSLSDCYDVCAESARTSISNSLGICCGRWNGADIVWDLSAHEINLWPGNSPSMVLQADRLSAAPGATASREKTWAGGGRWSALLASAAQWVVAALRKRAVPIVFHDGLLDMLQLCDKFLACGIPRKHSDFGPAWLQEFPVMYDTKLLIQSGSRQRELCSRELEFEHLRAHLDKMLSLRRRRPFQELGPLWKRRSTEKLRPNGYSGEFALARDAMVIAEVFLLEAAPLCEIDKVLLANRKHNDPAVIPQKVKSKVKRSSANSNSSHSVEASQHSKRNHDCDKSKSDKNVVAAPVTPKLQAKRALELLSSKENPITPPQKQRRGENLNHASNEGKVVSGSSPALLFSGACAPFCNHVAAASVTDHRFLLSHSKAAESELPAQGASRLRSIVKALGAKKDSAGRLVVTPSMAKDLKRALRDVRGQAKATS